MSLSATPFRRLNARSGRGAVLLIVLVTMMFAALALLALMERAGTDMLVEAKQANALRLRTEAYSAAESTLAVVAAFKEVLGDLHSPSEGWSDPLGFCGYEPGDGRKVEVTFEDESGRIPLSTVEAAAMVNVMKSWGIEQAKAEKVTDGVLGWMRKDYVAMSGIANDVDAYEHAEIPYEPPYRVLRSYEELASIAGARDVLYDDKGVPNEFWKRFTETFSLYDYKDSNINAAGGDLLAMASLPDAGLQKQLGDYLGGKGAYEGRGRGFFKSTGEIAGILGHDVPVNGIDTVIKALRVNITVSEGNNRYGLSILVAPPGGATIPKPPEDATKDPAKTTDAKSQKDPAATQSTGTDGATDDQKNLKYPFAVLEISENDGASHSNESPSPPTP